MPAFELDSTYLICINTNGTEVISTPMISTGLSPSLYTFEWSLDGNVLAGETGPGLEPSQGGTYSVVVTDMATGCMGTGTTLVEVSEPPVISTEVTTAAFADQHNILVSAEGNGIAVYEFSLDGGAWVANEPNGGTYTFENVGAGAHTVTVRDINGCGEASAPVMVMDYPLYFTPNGDGYNDTWNIYGIAGQPDAKVFVFDRYGKLLKQLSPTGNGWDGTYNGSPMPSSDYWFTVEYREPNGASGTKKTFKAHFTLKR